VRKIVITVTLALCSILFSASAQAVESEYESLSQVDGQIIYLGDLVRIDANYCWATKKPTSANAKKRLEVFVSGKWKQVGRNEFIKSPRCSAKSPYIQRYVWEVDLLGESTPGGISGKLRIRDSSSKPSIYVQTTVFESESAYQDAEDAKADAERKLENERRLKAELMFMCLIQGGEWNSMAEYCVK